MSDSLQPCGLYSPRNSLGQNTGVGSLSLIRGILPTQGSNPGLPHRRQILYQLSHRGSPTYINTINYCEKDTLCLTETFKWNYYCSGEDQRISSEKKCLTECTGWLLCVTTNFKSCQARLFGVCPSKFQILVLFKWLVSKSRDTSQWEPSIWMTYRCITSDFFNN